MTARSETIVLLLIAAGILVGCHGQSTQPYPATQSSDVGNKDAEWVLRIGMPWAAGQRLLGSAGAEEITGTVSIRMVSVDGDPVVGTAWFLLPDKTCLMVITAQGPTTDKPEPLIRSLELGSKGQGYPGKYEWLRQTGNLRPETLDLRQFSR